MCWASWIVDEKGLGGIEYELDSEIRGKSEKIIVMADARQRWFDGGEAQARSRRQRCSHDGRKDSVHRGARTGCGDCEDARPGRNGDRAESQIPARSWRWRIGRSSIPMRRLRRAAETRDEPRGHVDLRTGFDIQTDYAGRGASIKNLIRPDEVFDCENGKVYVAGHRIRDHKPFGLLTVSEILAQSSDVGAIKIALRLGAPKFYEYIRAFGFGQPTGVDLPGESRGMLRRLENWSAVSIGSISMGQEVGVTPHSDGHSGVRDRQRRNALQASRRCGAMRRGDTSLPVEWTCCRRASREEVIRPETAATLRR